MNRQTQAIQRSQIIADYTALNCNRITFHTMYTDASVGELLPNSYEQK